MPVSSVERQPLLPSAFLEARRPGTLFPNEPDDCYYYRCSRCNFLFTDVLDAEDHAALYNETYWNNQDPDWHGRVTETFRLVFLANELLRKRGEDLEILDFGCGMGTFVESARKSLSFDAWGTDLIKPRFGLEWFLPDLGDKKFDVVTACESYRGICRILRRAFDPHPFAPQVTRGFRLSNRSVGPVLPRSRLVVLGSPKRSYQPLQSRRT